MAELRDLGPGDEVAIERRWQAPLILRIVRVTDTQIVTESGLRWSRETGRTIPRKRGCYDRIEPATDAHRNAVERASLRIEIEDAMRRRAFDRLSTDTLRAIAAAIAADPAGGDHD